ncbi:secretin and TonB N-terminal domain-containing protein [Chitiniphilus purpureus]|uniref:Secretin and TonB N-terminal domain-containing protein n=1 Tax=Chitiniphilus purpureus TaxID=2981137 RepID=A0ABY6DSW2_9NEIS|nr:secretin N-terminal domain-containing protein [Chitiniphilus sp. CD1]UXY16808.1 secretin and TonB N-terminal domain-containing protein [Chitiniphilus sp. CD1]
MKRALTITLIATALLMGCAADRARQQGTNMIQQGEAQQGLGYLKEQLAQHPNDAKLRAAYERELIRLLQQLQAEAETAIERADYATATARYQQMLSWDASNYRAKEALLQLEGAAKRDSMLRFAKENKDLRPDEALEVLKQILADDPRNTQAQRLKDDILARRAREANLKPVLAQALKSPISLQFRDQPLMSVFDIIARIGKVNFIFDRDVPPNLKTTIFARDTTVEDVINLLLATNQLEKKILNDNTIMIYPKRPDKDRDYKDLVMRTFYLNNADPKQVLAMLKQMVKTRDVYIDERLNMIIMRDTPEAIAVAERLITAQDLPQSEVVFDVEVLEVTDSDVLNLGIRYPDSLTAELSTTLDGTNASSLTLSKLANINRSNVLVNLGKPSITANFLQRRGDTTLLANPKIRVKNRDKAKVVIGDRLPVITTTNSNGVTSETVNYQDVGLTLNVEPAISNEGDIGVKVTLEVSNLVEKVPTANGGVAYQIGTRRAETNMSVRDGETQVLAGLLQRSNQITKAGLPGLSDLPILDRLFGSRNDDRKQTEVILMITPRIVRNLSVPGQYVTQFDSGTESSISTDPLRLRNASTVTINAPSGGTQPMAQPMPQPVPQPQPAPQPVPQDQPAAEPIRAGMGRR